MKWIDVWDDGEFRDYSDYKLSSLLVASQRNDDKVFFSFFNK